MRLQSCARRILGSETRLPGVGLVNRNPRARGLERPPPAVLPEDPLPQNLAAGREVRDVADLENRDHPAGYSASGELELEDETIAPVDQTLRLVARIREVRVELGDELVPAVVAEIERVQAQPLGARISSKTGRGCRLCARMPPGILRDYPKRVCSDRGVLPNLTLGKSTTIGDRGRQPSLATSATWAPGGT
jgi:hypothetical protein